MSIEHTSARLESPSRAAKTPIPFDTVHGTSRLWCIAVESELSAEQARGLRAALAGFAANWKSHGVPVLGAFEIRYNRFILFAAENGPDVSGCSIDSLTNEVRHAVAKAGAMLANPATIYFRDGSQIRAVTREGFTELKASDAVGDQTIVFDQTVSTVDAYRNGSWELPLGKSWHSRL